MAIAYFLSIPRQSDYSGEPLLSRLRELDLIGAAFLIPSIVCLLLVLQWGGSTYPWNSSRIIGLLVGFGCLLIIFVVTQIKQGDRATLPIHILSQRTVAASISYAVMFGGGFFVLLFYLPLYFQSIKDASATKSGIEILPLLLSAVLSSIVTGGLVTGLGYYTPVLIFSTVLFAIGAGLISTYSVDMSFGKWFGYQILAGAGIGAGFQSPIIAVQTVLPLEDVAVGSACVAFFQTLGGALFVSVAQTVFQNGLIRGVNKFVPELDPTTLLRVGATEIRSTLSVMGMLDKLPAVLDAYMVGLVDGYRVPFGLASAAIIATLFLEWRSVKDEDAKEKQEAAMGV